MRRAVQVREEVAHAGLEGGVCAREVGRLLPDAADRHELFWDTLRRWLAF